MATCSIGKIISLPDTNFSDYFWLVVWNVERIEKYYASIMSFQGSSSSKIFLSSSNVLTKLSSTWFIRLMIELAWGFPYVSGLEIILYSYSMKVFFNSWPKNSYPRQYVISVGRGYLASHVFPTNLVIAIVLLSALIWTIQWRGGCW